MSNGYLLVISILGAALNSGILLLVGVALKKLDSVSRDVKEIRDSLSRHAERIAVLEATSNAQEKDLTELMRNIHEISTRGCARMCATTTYTETA